MTKFIEMIKASKKTAKPKQTVKGKGLSLGGESTGPSHCQGGGGW